MSWLSRWLDRDVEQLPIDQWLAPPAAKSDFLALEPPETPPYSGDDARCAKCWSTDVDREWQRGHLHVRDGKYSLDKSYEYLRRTCQECGYRWDEQCADAM